MLKCTATLAGGRIGNTNSVSPEDEVPTGSHHWCHLHLVKPPLGLSIQARLSVQLVTAIPLPSWWLWVKSGCRPMGCVRGVPQGSCSGSCPAALAVGRGIMTAWESLVMASQMKCILLSNPLELSDAKSQQKSTRVRGGVGLLHAPEQTVLCWT